MKAESCLSTTTAHEAPFLPYYSLSDVVLGNIPAYKLVDKIVLLGFTSKIYQDLYSVPFQKYDYPGVEIHATIIENIIRAEYQQRKPLVNKFCEGLNAYKNRQWDQAIAFFQEAFQITPDDKPAQIYIERCTKYLQHPPPEDWDGVFEMKTK